MDASKAIGAGLGAVNLALYSSWAWQRVGLVGDRGITPAASTVLRLQAIRERLTRSANRAAYAAAEAASASTPERTDGPGQPLVRSEWTVERVLQTARSRLARLWIQLRPTALVLWESPTIFLFTGASDPAQLLVLVVGFCAAYSM